MKKISLISLVIIATMLSVNADGWDDLADVERMWDGQKTITNQQFEEVVDALEQGEKKKEEKQQKKKIKKISGGGTSLHKDLNPESEILSNSPLKPSEEGLLINVPVNLIIDNNPVDKGFYKLIGERDENGKVYISFYQSQFFKGKVIAVETEEDFEEKEINFARMIPYNENFVKIIFGSLDYNAYAFIPFVE